MHLFIVHFISLERVLYIFVILNFLNTCVFIINKWKSCNRKILKIQLKFLGFDFNTALLRVFMQQAKMPQFFAPIYWASREIIEVKVLSDRQSHKLFDNRKQLCVTFWSKNLRHRRGLGNWVWLVCVCVCETWETSRGNCAQQELNQGLYHDKGPQ